LERKNAAAAEIARLFSLLDGEAIPRELPIAGGMVADRIALNDAFGALLAQSLVTPIEPAGEVYRMHPLTQRVIRASLGQDGLRDRAGLAVDLVARAWEVWAQEPELGKLLVRQAEVCLGYIDSYQLSGRAADAIRAITGSRS
jgi:hypothetical protein